MRARCANKQIRLCVKYSDKEVDDNDPSTFGICKLKIKHGPSSGWGCENLAGSYKDVTQAGGSNGDLFQGEYHGNVAQLRASAVRTLAAPCRRIGSTAPAPGCPTRGLPLHPQLCGEARPFTRRCMTKIGCEGRGDANGELRPGITQVMGTRKGGKKNTECPSTCDGCSLIPSESQLPDNNVNNINCWPSEEYSDVKLCQSFITQRHT